MPCPSLHELPPPPAGKRGWPWTEQSPPLVASPDAAGNAVDAWPKITVVTPVYNSAAFIEETIRSVLLQGYPQLEYIVIDGGSTDGTVEVIRRYAPWLTFWCSEADRGQSHALNKGFARATGDWLAWLNADDTYLPNALAQVALTACREPSTHWIVGVLRFVDAQGALAGLAAPTPFAEVGQPAQWQAGAWMAHVCFRAAGLYRPQPSSFWSRVAHVAVGPLDENLHYSMDLDHWGKLAHANFTPMLIAAELANFRMHNSQKSANGELRFMVDELAIVDKWLQQLTGAEYATMATYRQWLQQVMVQQQQALVVERKQRHWQRLMRNPYYHGIFTLAKNILNSTHLSRAVLRQLNKRRPAWMYFYG